MHRSALMARLAPLLLLAALAATGTAHAETARCHVVYGGEEWTVDAAPTTTPYQVAGRKIGRYFEFKLVYADLPTTGRFIRVYTYGMTTGDPVLIHQATYRPPFLEFDDGSRARAAFFRLTIANPLED